ncbi:MAG: alpha-2-macroglobulin, partial [Pseudomonadota bacterium]
IANANGYAQFAAPLTRGEGALQPAVIVAEHADGGYAFLKLDQAAFDLTDRGVKGRVAPGPIDGFLYTDRGVYRAGETVHVTGLVRTRQGTASRVPTTLIVARPDGVTHKTIALKDQADGGRTMALNLPKGAMRGTWRLRLHVDPKKPAIADAAVLVEDFLPERLALELELAKDKPLAMTGTSRIGIAGRYLYGPPAANLAIEGSVVVRAAKSDPAHPGFVFGDAEQLVTPVRGGLPIEQRTNADGRADLNFKLPPVPRTGRPLEAQVLVRLREPGGRTIERRTVRPVSADIARIGVKPAFKDATVREDTDASFTLVFLDRAGAPKPAANLTWQLVRLERHWQWYKRGASWSYDAVVIPRQVANGDVTTGTDGAARIKVPTEWGRYRLEVTSPDQDADQLRTTMLFTSGWNQSDDADSPEVLDVAADRKSYRPGETAKIRVSSQMAGRATVAILSDRLITTKTVELGAGDSEIAVPVEETWGAGAYAAVILHRPMDIAEKRMPSRALGLTWIATDISAKSLTVALNPVAKMKSGQALSVPVSVSGLGANERAHVTVAAVDVGILNVTRFRAPSATGRFLKQLQLGAEIRDVYAKLIDGMSGERATFRSGGDADASLSLQAAPPMWKTVALFSGIVTTDADGRANVSFDIPEFAGTVRLMAVAWTKTKIGEASTDVTVRDPFALTVTTPRFLALGDTAELTFDIHNIEAPAGDYKIALSAVTDDGPVRLLKGQTATFARGERKVLAVPFKADRLGTAQIIAQVRGEAAPGSTPIAIKRELTFEVVAPGGDVKRTTTRTLQPGKQLVIDQGAVDGLIADGANLAVSVGPAAALDVPGLLASLDRYPYGCTEQTISRALPLLYANALGSTAGLEADANIAPRIRDAITRILGRQDSAGGFGIWSPSSPDLWLSAYTTDFLTRAREEGYAVPARAIKSAIQRLANFVAYTQNVQGDGASLAYALYALARNGRVPAGELRYYAETKLAAFKSPTAKAQLAAALTMIGDRQRARQVFDGAVASLKAQGPTGDQLTGRRDFGSRLRDVASVAALAAEAGFSGLSQRLMPELEGRLAARSLTSTQEQAWTLMAARALQATGADQTLTVNGRAHTGPLAVTYAARAIGNQSTTITNTSTTPTVVSMTAIGPSLGNEPAASNGFEIERRYYTLDGQPATLGTAGDAAAIAQNQKLVVVLTVRSAKKGGRVLLVDRLPAGLEIENPALVASGAIKALGWIKSDLQPVHTEFRDDRFVAAYNLFGGRTVEGGGHVFHAAYIVRAVSKGTFAHPAATVEDMYRPERNARTASGRLTIAGRS